MYIVICTLFTIIKNWKQPKCPQMSKLTNKL